MHIHKTVLKLFIETVVNCGTVKWRLYDLCISLWSGFGGETSELLELGI